MRFLVRACGLFQVAVRDRAAHIVDGDSRGALAVRIAIFPGSPGAKSGVLSCDGVDEPRFEVNRSNGCEVLANRLYTEQEMVAGRVGPLCSNQCWLGNSEFSRRKEGIATGWTPRDGNSSAGETLSPFAMTP